MFDHETGYDYETWIKDVWNEPGKAGYPAWLLFALLAVVGGAVYLLIWEHLPPGRYPRIVISGPTAVVLAIFYPIASRLIFMLLVDGHPRPE